MLNGCARSWQLGMWFWLVLRLDLHGGGGGFWVYLTSCIGKSAIMMNWVECHTNLHADSKPSTTHNALEA